MAPLHNTQFRARVGKTWDKSDIRVIFHPEYGWKRRRKQTLSHWYENFCAVKTGHETNMKSQQPDYYGHSEFTPLKSDWQTKVDASVLLLIANFIITWSK